MTQNQSIQQAMEALDSAMGEQLVKAVEVLGEHRHVPAVEKMVAILNEQNPDPGTRFIIIKALGQIAHTGALTVLLEALHGHDIWVRAAATGALINIGEPAVSGLVDALRDEDKAVRRAAAKALGKIGATGDNNEVVRGLSVGLLDVDGAVRKFAAEALGRLEAKSMVPELSETLRDSNADVRLAAFRALAKIDTPEARSAVRQWAKQ